MKKGLFWLILGIIAAAAAVYMFVIRKERKEAKNKPEPTGSGAAAAAQPSGGSAPVPGSGFQEDCVTVPAGQSYDPAQNGGLPPCYNANDPSSPPLNTDSRFPKS